MLKKFFNHEFFTAGFVYVALTFLSGALGFLFHFLISRRMSVGEYGEFQSLTSVYTIFGVFSVAVPNFAVKYSSVIARARDKISGKEFLDWLNEKMKLISILAFIGIIIFMPLLKYYLRLSDYLGLTTVALAIAVTAASSGYAGVFTGWSMFVYAGLSMLACMIVKILSAFVVVSLAPFASAVSSVYAISTVALWLASIFFARKMFTENSKTSNQLAWREKYFPNINIRKSILPISFYSFMIILLQYVDVMAIKNISSSEITGHYGALKMLGVVILTINLAIVALFLPDACAAGHSGKCVSKKTLALVYGALFVVNIPSILFYYFFPDFTINLLFGAKYILYAEELWLFGLAAFLFALLNLEANFAYGRHDYKISYILVGTAALMVSGLYFYHDSVRTMISAVATSFIIGYLSAFALNLLHRKNNLHGLELEIEENPSIFVPK